MPDCKVGLGVAVVGLAGGLQWLILVGVAGGAGCHGICIARHNVLFSIEINF